MYRVTAENKFMPGGTVACNWNNIPQTIWDYMNCKNDNLNPIITYTGA